MIVKSAIDGMLGFDLNQPLTGIQYSEFKNAGYDFAIRYLPRTSALVKGNLSLPEIQAILGTGLALCAVQHVALPGWQPNAALGDQYGNYAGQYAAEIGLPLEVSVWLDLEEVAQSSKAEDIIGYCHSWFSGVESHGYVPGLYVGYGTGLSDDQLYSLPFQHYWRAYNCDQNIPNRGYQIIQQTQKTLNGITFDPNKIQADKLGDLPKLLFPV